MSVCQVLHALQAFTIAHYVAKHLQTQRQPTRTLGTVLWSAENKRVFVNMFVYEHTVADKLFIHVRRELQ
jgi:hypothetical protein